MHTATKMLKLQHHAAVHISVTFGTVCHVSVAAGKSSHFSIALAANADVLIIVEFNENTLLQDAVTLLVVFIFADLEKTPIPFAVAVDAVAICELNNLTLSTEPVAVDEVETLALP